jgi:hypothetical protein
MKSISALAIVSIIAILLAIGLVYMITKPPKITTTTTTIIEEKTYTITLTNIQYSTITHTYTIPPTTFTTTVPITITTIMTITTKIKEDLVIINPEIHTGQFIVNNVPKEKTLSICFTPINLGNKNITIRSSSIRAIGAGLLNETPSMIFWYCGPSGFMIEEIDLSLSSEYYNKVWCDLTWIEGESLDPSKVVLGGNYTVFVPYKIDGEERVLNFTVTLKEFGYGWKK